MNVAAYAPPNALGMRIAPIIQEKQATLFFGDGDSLKSFFATYLAVLVRSGITQNELSPEPGNVLYLDYETDIDTFWTRVDMITTGLAIAPPDGLFYRQMLEPLADELPRINAVVMDHKIEFVVVDSAAPAVLEPNSPEATTAFFRSLRSLQLTSLTIAHQTKGAKGDYPFGSTFWRNLPRSNFHIKADRTEDNVSIALRHTKANNSIRLKTMAFEFTFSQDGLEVDIRKTDASKHEELARDLPARDKIHSVLTHPMTIQEIAIATDCRADTIQRTLDRGRSNGHFSKNGKLWAKTFTGDAGRGQ